MTLLLIIASAAFTLLAAYHLVVPFLSSRQDQLRFEVLDEDLRRVEELAARKSTLLKTLRDVAFEFETDKISEADYLALKQRYERQAVEVMRALDELHGGRGWQESIDDELERRLAQAKAARMGDAESAADRPAPGRPAPDAPDESTADTVVCADCHKEMEADARFCSQCGATIAQDAPSQDKGDDEQENALSEESDDQTSPEQDARALPRSGSEVAT